MFSFIQIVTALVLAGIAYWWISWKRNERRLKWIPKVPGHPIFGNVLDFGKTTDTLTILSKYTKSHDGLCMVDLVFRKLVLITDLKLVEFFLTSTKILDKSSEYRFLERWLGDGILIAKAARWRKSRKIITPAFHFGILARFVSTYDSNAEIMVQLLEKEVGKGSVDIYNYVTMCTLDVIYETSMGVKINAQTNKQPEYAFAVKEICRITIDRGFSALKQSNMLYPLTRDYYKESKYVKFLHANTDSVIRARRKALQANLSGSEGQRTDEDLGEKKKLAFLDLMLLSKVDGEPLPDWYIKEEVNTLLFEGHDTTGVAISFALYSLAENPEVQARAVEEQRTIFGRS
ncbi:cytochrome P450 4d2 [Anoplophora glabripennis]|uniref:cytochrome P450 4d2 n=1 Tax=Anoplophora glabripennis TaxID=217634 RepID=UPI000C757BD9|nr:cytochrome P450 4d2 [Anoplophora glabripennis]